MAFIINEPSRTFGEYLLLPNLTTKDCIVENVDLRTPITRFKKGEAPEIKLNIPFSSAIMQSVSDNNMAIALAKNGGISFIYCSQSIDNEAEMVRKVKKYKAGFVISDSNLTPEHTLMDVLELKAETGHSTMAITEDGSPSGKLLGIVTGRDYRTSRDSLDKKVKDFMTRGEKLIVGKEGITLSEANDIIWEHKLNSLPIIDKDFRLVYMVFRKDYSEDKENPNSLL
ncbi:MAG TPA: IMP dehydrogenase, partial [Clostridiales bacterium]|nr:IMP dehydrogenase [Clostridiales bacterium]